MPTWLRSFEEDQYSEFTSFRLARFREPLLQRVWRSVSLDLQRQSLENAPDQAGAVISRGVGTAFGGRGAPRRSMIA
jgi:hypothetical protein